MEMRAVAIGAITRQLLPLAIGSSGTFAGFLTAGRNGRGLSFHVTEVELLT
jgi:primosomal replication protein N